MVVWLLVLRFIYYSSYQYQEVISTPPPSSNMNMCTFFVSFMAWLSMWLSLLFKKYPKTKFSIKGWHPHTLGCTMEIWLLHWAKKHLTCLPFLLICKTCYFSHDIIAHLCHLNMHSLNDMCPFWLMLYLMHLLDVNTRNFYLAKHWHNGWNLHCASLYLMILHIFAIWVNIHQTTCALCVECYT